MENKQLFRVGGIALLIICAVCVFVAIERYQANASNVKAMNAMGGVFPFGNGGMKMQPATPAATKYALFFATLSGAGGLCLLAFSGRQQSQAGAPVEKP
jgi:hypothetical protein